MRQLFLTALLLSITLTPVVRAQTNATQAEILIQKVVGAVGGTKALYQLNDISYQLHTSHGTTEERYILDGELSVGISGDRTEYYDGNEALVYEGGQLLDDQKATESAFFRRKTNLYWLLMIHKMADPGLLYDHAETITVNGIDYEVVDVTFEDGIGVAKDRYRLFINPYTHLVDQFLFTVAAVGRTQPILMKYQYRTFENGVTLPVLRWSHAAKNWRGELDPDGKWSVPKHLTDFRFDQGLTAEMIRE